LSGTIQGVTALPDGRILLLGVRTADLVDNNFGIVCLNFDGEYCDDFNAGQGFGYGAFWRVFHASVQSNGKIVVTHDALEYRGESLLLTNGLSQWTGFVIRLNGFINGPLGTHESVAEQTLKIWPNPANDSFQLEVTASSQMAKVEVRVCDLQGREVFRSQANASPLTIRTQDWPAGLYVLHTSDPGVTPLKVVVH